MEDLVKTGVLGGSRKEADKPGNYKGVCLLAMRSRIFARLLAKRLRDWTEKNDILDNYQSGLRPG